MWATVFFSGETFILSLGENLFSLSVKLIFFSSFSYRIFMWEKVWKNKVSFSFHVWGKKHHKNMLLLNAKLPWKGSSVALQPLKAEIKKQTGKSKNSYDKTFFKQLIHLLITSFTLGWKLFTWFYKKKFHEFFFLVSHGGKKKIFYIFFFFFLRFHITIK